MQLVPLTAPVVLAALAAACGSGSSGGLSDSRSPGDTAASGACQDQPQAGAVTVVALRVSSPLPTAMTANCPHGNLTKLAAYLLDAVPAGACGLQVSGSVVTGCCENVPANQNPWLTLAFRETVLNLWLADQGKMVPLPSTSPPVVDLSFANVSVDRPYDTDGDGADNLIEWCAGTLSL